MSDDKYYENEQHFRHDRGMDMQMDDRDGDDRGRGGKGGKVFFKKKNLQILRTENEDRL